MQTPTSNKPNRTRLTTHTAWVAGWKCRLRFGISNAGWKSARSEALGALEIYERLGAAGDAGRCRGLLQQIEEAMGTRLSGKLDSGGEFSSHGTTLHPC